MKLQSVSFNNSSSRLRYPPMNNAEVLQNQISEDTAFDLINSQQRPMTSVPQVKANWKVSPGPSSNAAMIAAGQPITNNDRVMHMSNKDYTDFYNDELKSQIQKFERLSSQQSQN